MTNPLNRIGINSLAVGNNFEGGAKNTKPEVEEKEEQAAPLPEAKPQLSANEVLDYMAANAVHVKPSFGNYEKLIDKYNTPEQKARIADSVKTFEEQVLPSLKEFNLSDELIDKIAAGVAERL